MQDYQKLVVWKRAHEFVLKIYALTLHFPDGERYGLTNQMRRAAVSIPANIAEGCGRETMNELRRFLYISMGSASELEYYLYLAHDLKFIQPADYPLLRGEMDEIKRMLNAFIQKLKN